MEWFVLLFRGTRMTFQEVHTLNGVFSQTPEGKFLVAKFEFE
jgi:hypothetical protein